MSYSSSRWPLTKIHHQSVNKYQQNGLAIAASAISKGNKSQVVVVRLSKNLSLTGASCFWVLLSLLFSSLPSSFK